MGHVEVVVVVGRVEVVVVGRVKVVCLTAVGGSCKLVTIKHYPKRHDTCRLGLFS